MQRLTINDLPRINDLLQQLSPDPDREPVRFGHLLVVGMTSRLLIARDNELIVGMGTLIPVIKPSGRDGYIEDIAVDQSYHGQGIGKMLTQKLIEEARRLYLSTIRLTSHPCGIAANQLYQHLGFQQREANVYSLLLT
jgi:ribosomal protein S18 acetylase RimI-like enzyme